MKTCSKCGIEKPLDGFHRLTKSPDGRRPRCKSCMSAYYAEHYQNNRERRITQVREYYRANQPRISEYWKQYRKDNADVVKYRKLKYVHARRARKLLLPYETVAVKQVAVRDGAWCWLCGDELSDFDPSHMDHLIPLSADTDLLTAWGVENPGTVLANMALACPSCNMSKSNKVLPCAIARYLRNSEPLEAIA